MYSICLRVIQIVFGFEVIGAAGMDAFMTLRLHLFCNLGRMFNNNQLEKAGTLLNTKKYTVENENAE